MGEQLVLLLEDRRQAVPWEGDSPRTLTRGYLLGVDKSRKFGEGASRIGRSDPRQLTLFLKGSPSHGT